MRKKIDKYGLISAISQKARFNLGDTKVFLDTLIEVMEDCVINDVELSVRGFGKLYVQEYVSKPSFLRQETPAKIKRVIFRLSQNIRDLVK